MVQRWNTFSELQQMHDTMERLWSRFFYGDGAPEAWVVPVDVFQDGEKVIVRASIPGANPEDIQVTVEDGVLLIKGQTWARHEPEGAEYLMQECRSGSFYRALRLPDTVDADKAESSYENGMLYITFPKLESKRARHIPISAASQPAAIEAPAVPSEQAA